MKIIKEGNLKPKETKKTCSKCKTKFSYTDEDIIRDWKDGDFVNCPKCNNSIFAT